MSNVIKEAFVEGRDTEVEWKASQAKQNALKLDIFANNEIVAESRAANSVIPMSRVCSETGKVLETYPSRLAACRWVVANVLKRPDPNNTKAMSIAGNMHMSMKLGWKSYGFLWTMLKHEDYLQVLTTDAGKDGQAIWVYGSGMGRKGKRSQTVFGSIADAAKATCVPVSDIIKNMKYGSPAVNGHTFRVCNATKSVKAFASYREAADYLGVDMSTIHGVIASSRPMNNQKIVVKNTAGRMGYEILLRRDKQKGIRFETYTDAATFLGVNRMTVTRAANTQKRIDRYTITATPKYYK